MAFPTVAGNTTGETSGNQTSVVVTLPGSIASGDLIIAFVASDAGATSYTWPSPWVELVDAGHTGFVMSIGYLFASGGETSVTVTQTSERATWGSYRITGAHSSQAPAVTAGATGNSTTPDPGSLGPVAWGAEDNLWIAMFGCDDSAVPFPVTAFPYANNNISKQYAGASPPSAGAFAACTTTSAVDTLDPGTFTLTTGETWRAYTIAVRPAGAAASPYIKSLRLLGVGT